MPASDIVDWLDRHGTEGFLLYVKRLSGNDTLANKSHQAGPYIPRDFLFRVLPALNRPDVYNPEVRFNLYLDSHADAREIRAVWYNNKLHGCQAKRPRDETRFTGFGGASSALLDPENTGALTVFAFRKNVGMAPAECHVWVCEHETEEDIIEDRVGPVEPGKWLVWPPEDALPSAGTTFHPVRSSCWLETHEIPEAWLTRFPSGAEIIRRAVEMRQDAGLDPDKRLIRRRNCEFEVFQSVEQAIELPHIHAGFATVNDFLARAQTIIQRRKSRAGRSLELHLRAIFVEERLTEGVNFSQQCTSEPGKKPDFLFPSEAAYRNPDFPASKLRMLAVKTTCKDRWRQILNEADRIPTKHLLTLQEGISENQFREMINANVSLVVPSGLVSSFPKPVRPYLQSLESFIGDVRLLTV